jgi:methyl-accepting chemotaxis protein
MSKEFDAIEPVIAEIQQSVELLYKQADTAEAAARDSINLWMLLALGLAVVVVSGVSFLIGRSISNALSAMVGVMTRLSGGDSTIAIPSLGRKDEVGEMAGAVRVCKTNMIDTERLRAEQLDAAQRQLRQRKADMHELADASFMMFATSGTSRRC